MQHTALAGLHTGCVAMAGKDTRCFNLCTIVMHIRQAGRDVQCWANKRGKELGQVALQAVPASTAQLHMHATSRVR